MRKTKPFEDRLWSRIRVNPTTLCWEWQGHSCGRGYGSIQKDGKQIKVHRVVYELHFGAIADGLQLDHLCRNRKCCNPAHLEPVTQQENIRRGLMGTLHEPPTHCARGHEFTPENTYYWKNTRTCRACNLYYTRVRRGKISRDGLRSGRIA